MGAAECRPLGAGLGRWVPGGQAGEGRHGRWRRVLPGRLRSFPACEDDERQGRDRGEHTAQRQPPRWGVRRGAPQQQGQRGGDDDAAEHAGAGRQIHAPGGQPTLARNLDQRPDDGQQQCEAEQRQRASIALRPCEQRSGGQQCAAKRVVEGAAQCDELQAQHEHGQAEQARQTGQAQVEQPPAETLVRSVRSVRSVRRVGRSALHPDSHRSPWLGVFAQVGRDKRLASAKRSP